MSLNFDDLDIIYVRFVKIIKIKSDLVNPVKTI